MGKSIIKNLIYNLLFQVATLILPLITVPYVSRILGADGVGTYGYTLSITQYFILFGTLGLSLYGNRQIAYTRDDKQKMSKTFWSILVLRVITSGVATLIYVIIFVFFDVQVYKEIFIIQTLNIVSAMIDISWLYMGLEDFRKTVTRNLTVKIAGVVLIFVLIKSKNDLNLYVLINVLMIFAGNAVMWAYLPKTVSRVRIDFRDMANHILPSLQLFVPQIAIQIYTILDKTMIGVLTNVTEVGYYEQSEKIVKVILGLVTALGTVMLPRMSNLFANGDKVKMDSYLNTSLKIVTYIAVPLTIGLCGISNELVPWFFGKNFEAVKYIIPLLSPILLFISLSNVMGVQYLLPSDRTREYTGSVTFSAIINVILNLIFIPKFGAIGACIGTIAAELGVTAVQYSFLRKEINIGDYLGSLVKYLAAGLIMFVVIRFIGNAMGAGIFTTIIQTISGALAFLSILAIMREEMNIFLYRILLNNVRKALPVHSKN